MRTTESHNDLAGRSLWIALLTGATIAASFVFACATPFPALGALAALHMRKRDAFVLTGVNWLANQIIGYGFLQYPHTWDSFGWGAAVGIAALLATAVAIGLRTVVQSWIWAVGAVAVFAGAFAAYELGLYAATVVLPADDSFTTQVVMYVLQVNGIAFASLLVLQGLGSMVGLAPRSVAAAV